MMMFMMKLNKFFLLFFAIVLIGAVCAVVGFIVAANLAVVYELVAIEPFVVYGREGYESAGPIGFVAGALIGMIAIIYLYVDRLGKNNVPFLPKLKRG